MTKVFAFLLAGWVVAAADSGWTQFRGPNGSGVYSAAGYPVEFSPTKNVVWKKPIPFGQSSPVVAGGRLYFTASEGDRLVAICLDAKTGRELWKRNSVARTPTNSSARVVRPRLLPPPTASSTVSVPQSSKGC
jgi:outer membrane protein assembly factor BamB